MYLKALEISGFKSFANPTTINFHRGVTAVIGPNGCGKSNVLDAIRWALGEQSAKALRGGQMQDVIFNGTDSKKPLGMAEVSMTFADCEKHLGTDFNEVRITRRVFRDGGSEYELNKTPCRLRDIHQLFMDTGIGRSAYSIMEQGKIDAILSSKPEERRAIFEEAAGITRFKSQKKEAMRKLEAAESNLIRVSDIIKEVRRQIGSLQRQAAKAKRYQELHSRLKELDTQLARHLFGELKSKLSTSQERFEQLSLEFSGLQGGLEEKESGLQQRRFEMNMLEEQLQTLERERSQSENGIEQSRTQIEYCESRIAELDGLIDRNRAEIATGQERIQMLEEQLQLVRTESETVGTEIASSETLVAEHQERLDTKKREVNEVHQERAGLDRQLQDLTRQLNESQTRLGSLELQKQTHQMRLDQLAGEEEGLQIRVSELEEQLVRLISLVTERESEQSRLQEEISSQRAAVQQRREAVEQARRVVEAAESDISRLQARADALGKLMNSRTGFSETARKLLERFGAGLSGSLLDHLEATPGYEKAVEACLGSAQQVLIVENPETLSQILAELENGGSVALVDQATLSSIETAGNRHRAESALNFVRGRAPVSRWLASLLQGHYIVDSAAEAEALRRELPFAFVATRGGEVFHPSGWQLRGKPGEKSHSILEYENEQKAVLAEVGIKRSEVESLHQSLEASRAAVSEAEQQLELVQQQRQEIEGAFASLRFERQGLERQKTDWSNRVEALRRERDHLISQDQTDAEQLEQLRVRVEEASIQREETSVRISGFGDRLASLTAEADSLNVTLSDARVELGSARQRRESLSHQLTTFDSRLSELQATLEQRSGEIGDFEARQARSREEITTAEQNAVEFEQKLITLREQIESERVRRQEVLQTLNALEEEARVDRRRVGELQSMSGREEVAIAEQNLHLNALVERMQRNYQIDLNAPEEIPVSEQEVVPAEEEIAGTPMENAPVEEEIAPPDWEAIHAEVAELRSKVDSMGPVNIEAITEYEELEQRHTFLETQERDLTSSKEQLLDAIKKINETTQVLFSETFAKIQTNFAEMFVELFGGGKAEITLVDSSDPLESGIDIVARPPGKQPQSISLLSGGEKTMTAVALLFSIYMVKPSPFCVLDEMDAPLDESNINRFIRILQRFVELSQFVVITHNKRTISSADVLYGVTMEEHGISKMVSLRLSRKEESPLFHENRDNTPSLADSVRGTVSAEG
jgi:chromosome segregation protein